MLLYSLVALLLTLIVNYFMKKAFIYLNESSRFLCQGSEIVTVQVFFLLLLFLIPSTITDNEISTGFFGMFLLRVQSSFGSVHCLGVCVVIF